MHRFDNKDMETIGTLVRSRQYRSDLFSFFDGKKIPWLKVIRKPNTKKNIVWFTHDALIDREIGNPAFKQKDDWLYDCYLTEKFIKKLWVEVAEYLIDPNSLLQEYRKDDGSINTLLMKSHLLTRLKEDDYIWYYWEIPTAMYAFYLWYNRNDNKN